MSLPVLPRRQESRRPLGRFEAHHKDVVEPLPPDQAAPVGVRHEVRLLRLRDEGPRPESVVEGLLRVAHHLRNGGVLLNLGLLGRHGPEPPLGEFGVCDVGREGLRHLPLDATQEVEPVLLEPVPR